MDRQGPHHLHGHEEGLDLMPASQRRQIFNGWKAPYELTSVQAGNVESVHEVTLSTASSSTCARRRPDRRSGVRLALHLPLQRQLGDEPDPGDVPGPRLLLQHVRGKPLVREGGVLIMSHPTPWEFHPVHHPSTSTSSSSSLPRRPIRSNSSRSTRSIRRGRVVHPPVPEQLRLPRHPSVLHVVLG